MRIRKKYSRGEKHDGRDLHEDLDCRVSRGGTSFCLREKLAQDLLLALGSRNLWRCAFHEIIDDYDFESYNYDVAEKSPPPFKNMQDHTPEHIVCSKCAAIIIPASRIQAYSERDVRKFVDQHKCHRQDESKRDFQDEVR